MYLRGIMVENESDEEIFEMIRTHARSNNVRIMSHKVIRHNYVWDVVGCKIVVPASQQHMVLTPGFWPQEIECMDWERLLPRKQHSQQYHPYSDYSSSDKQ